MNNQKMRFDSLLSVKVPKALYDTIIEEASQSGLSMGGVVRRVLEGKLTLNTSQNQTPNLAEGGENHT